MKKVLLFLFLLPFVVCSCSSDEKDDKRIVEEHSYYVKYEVHASSYDGFKYWPYFDMTYSFTTEEGLKRITTGLAKEHNWEAMYGPFKEGDIVMLGVSRAISNQARIYVSRDWEPFVIRAANAVENSSIMLQYTIEH